MKDDQIVPLQVMSLIHQLQDKNTDINIRGNYRSRLQAIQNVISQSIKKFDDEKFFQNTKNNTKPKRSVWKQT